MSESALYGGYSTVTRDQTRTLFSQTMGYVALTTALFGSPYTHIITLTLVIIALASMPQGLFGDAGVKTV